MKITKGQAVALLSMTQGRAFAVTFTKRTTGEVRHMNARLGVKKGVKGVGLKFDPSERDLLIVYDLQKQAFRSISLDSVTEVVVERRKYEVE